MNIHRPGRLLEWLPVFGLLMLLLLPAPSAAAETGKNGNTQPKEEDVLKKASVNWKYTKLLKKIEVPQDRNSVSDFHEWGHWDGTEWAGYTDLPPGYWVYVYPNWYIWGALSKPNEKSADKDTSKAAVDGKYKTLLKKINVPQDRDSFSDFHEWGYWDGTEWAGYTDLPPGYWVYVYPNWYIWKEGPPR